MTSGGGVFSAEEVEYLRSLPAVVEASAKRITYSDSFKRYCIRRYLEGASPVQLFREAGLDPSLIGHKRIERCFERWRRSEAMQFGVQQVTSSMHGARTADESDESDEPSIDDIDDESFASVINVIDDESGAKRRHARSGSHRDLRDVIIAQQVRRIDELEREVKKLRAALRRKADDTSSSARMGKDETGGNDDGVGGQDGEHLS